MEVGLKHNVAICSNLYSPDVAPLTFFVPMDQKEPERTLMVHSIMIIDASTNHIFTLGAIYTLQMFGGNWPPSNLCDIYQP